MSPILSNIITSDRNSNSPFSNVAHAAKSLDAEFSEENVHMEYLDYDANEIQRFQKGKRPPSSGDHTSLSEPTKRMRVVNLDDMSRGSDSHTGRMAPVDNGNKINALDEVAPMMEPQYIVDDGGQVVYEEQMNRSSDMSGIENETVEALMQSLSPYEFSFNEMGQLMITEPIFENEEPNTVAQNTTAIGDGVVVDQQLSECNINADDLDDIDQLVAPIFENSEGKTCTLRNGIEIRLVVKIFISLRNGKFKFKIKLFFSGRIRPRCINFSRRIRSRYDEEDIRFHK